MCESVYVFCLLWFLSIRLGICIRKDKVQRVVVEKLNTFRSDGYIISSAVDPSCCVDGKFENSNSKILERN